MRILFFTQEHCHACKVQDDELKLHAPNIPVQKIDLEKSREIFSEFGITQTPTLVMLDGNTEIKRAIMKFGNELKEWSEKHD